MKTEELYTFFKRCSCVITDSRKIEKDCLFIALKGDNFNGNLFAEEALQKGAAYALIDEVKYQTSDRIILVKDTLTALQNLASYHRKKLATPIISLTGSNGKTTTKELINAVLSKKYQTIATIGNLNNHIGVPLSLLQLKEDTEIGIIEMGANHQKEIAFLCSIANPDYGLITNFGKAHLEGFGGVKGVIKGKSEMYDYLIKEDKYVFYNEDDPIQLKKLKAYPHKKGFGASDSSNLSISLQKNNDHFLTLKADGSLINTQITGTYNLTNVAYAVLIGIYFKVSKTDIKDAIENYVPKNNRSQILEVNSNRIILDAYNANPSSMKAALDNLEAIKGVSKTAILGDMFELGDEASVEHQFIAEVAVSLTNTTVLLVGENFYKTNTPLSKFKTFEEAQEYLSNNLPQQKTILIKGSRGMALERLLNILN